MTRRRWLDVPERNHQVIFIDDVGWYLSGGDSLK
jgi:hypothetical protein